MTPADRAQDAILRKQLGPDDHRAGRPFGRSTRIAVVEAVYILARKDPSDVPHWVREFLAIQEPRRAA
jgi:hypothetical protein